jgi:hypothetical protein
VERNGNDAFELHAGLTLISWWSHIFRIGQHISRRFKNRSIFHPSINDNKIVFLKNMPNFHEQNLFITPFKLNISTTTVPGMKLFMSSCRILTMLWSGLTLPLRIST